MTFGSGKTVALTGATGFLGSHIADSLLAAGFSVRASVRPTSNLRWLQDKPLTTVETDLTCAQSCRDFLGDATAIIHCAGVVSATSEETYRTGNVTSTEVLLAVAKEVWQESTPEKPFFLLISSLAATGPAGLGSPATEDSPCQPITAYGRSKLAAENLVTGNQWSFRTAILRPPGLYGPRDRDFLPLFKAAQLGFTARIGRSMEGLSLVDGRDAAAAAVALLLSPQARGTFFVDDGHTGYDWQEMAQALGLALQKKVRLLTIPLAILKTLSALVGKSRATRSPVLNPDRIRDLETPGWVCDGSRLLAETGFVPQFDLGKGFSSTVQDLRQKGLL